MNKEEFIAKLKANLQKLPAEEREAAVNYYSDYIDDAGTENEQAVLTQLGDPAELAKTILKENGFKEPSTNEGAAGSPKVVKSSIPGWALVLIIIAAALFGFPIAITLISVFFGIIMTLVGLFFGLFAASFGLLVYGLATFVYGLMSLASPADALVLCGVGSILTGFGMLLGFVAFLLTAKLFPALIRGFVYICRLPFKKRSVNA